MTDTTADMIVCAWLILNTLVLAAVLIIVVSKRRTILSLRYKQPYYLYALIAFGIVTPWSVFIANDHLSALVAWQMYDCALWSYWLSHVFGINMWFVIMIMRLVEKMFVFHTPMSSWRRSRKIMIRASVIVMLTLPLILLASNVALAGWSRYDNVLNTCVSSHVETKLLLVVWYTLCFLIFNVLFRYVERDIHNAYFLDYMTLNDTSFVAQYVFVSNILTNLFGAVHQWYGRTLYTTNISILFSFTILRLCGKSVWHAIVGVRDVLLVEQTPTTSTLMYDMQFQSLLELRVSSDLMRGYFRFAIEKTNDPSRRRQLEFIIECIEEIERLQYSNIPAYHQKTIIMNYFGPGSMFNVTLPQEHHEAVLRKFDVRLARRYLFEYLELYFHGGEYLDLINGDADRVFSSQRPWRTSKPLANANQVRELLTADEWRTCQMYNDEDDDDHHNNGGETTKAVVPLAKLKPSTAATPLPIPQVVVQRVVDTAEDGDDDDDEFEDESHDIELHSDTESNNNNDNSGTKSRSPRHAIRTMTLSMKRSWKQSQRRRRLADVQYL